MGSMIGNNTTIFTYPSQIKVDMYGGRTRTHNESISDGKTFVTFIITYPVVIRLQILDKLSNYLAYNSTSLKKVFNQLSNICIITNYRNYSFVKALTKKQKQILTVCKANDSIVSSLKQSESTLEN